MAAILEFTILRASETVACSFATHRSVGAGSVLKHFLSTTETKSTATGKDVIVI